MKTYPLHLPLVAALMLAGSGCDSPPNPIIEPGSPGDAWDSVNGYEEEYDKRFAPRPRGDSSDFGMEAGLFGASDEVASGGAPPERTADARLGEGEGEGEGEWEPDPQRGGLEGGQIDDNELWDEYLAYAEAALASNIGDSQMVHWLDVSRRHFIQVVDASGRSVPNATVIVRSEEAVVATGLTVSDGRFAFYPEVYAPGQQGPFSIEIQQGELRATAELVTTSLTTELVLDGDRTPSRLAVDIAFVIDSTGSMGGEIRRIQDTILGIAADLASSEFDPNLRFGLVEYRDRGDEFLTHSINFTGNVDAFQHAVDGLSANGGGDMPEALNAALERTINRLEWRQEPTLKLAFVIADAPPHYYEDAAYTYDDAMIDAASMGLKIIPIASGGSNGVAEFIFRQLAQFTQGNFVFVTEGNGSPRGSEGSEYHVDEADFRVEALDSLIVDLVTAEMGAWERPAPLP